MMPASSRSGQMLRLLHWLVDDEKGEAVVEYALLAGFVALVTAPALLALQAVMRSTYISWNKAMSDCWKMPAPGEGGGC